VLRSGSEVLRSGPQVLRPASGVCGSGSEVLRPGSEVLRSPGSALLRSGSGALRRSRLCRSGSELLWTVELLRREGMLPAPDLQGSVPQGRQLLWRRGLLQLIIRGDLNVPTI
jgi:hypothetical protein